MLQVDRTCRKKEKKIFAAIHENMLKLKKPQILPKGQNFRFRPEKRPPPTRALFVLFHNDSRLLCPKGGHEGIPAH